MQLRRAADRLGTGRGDSDNLETLLLEQHAGSLQEA
jgi:hypothetical protein